MANPWHREPYTEDYQQAAYNGFPFLPEFGRRRNAPREEPFIRWQLHGHGGRGWYQGAHKLHGFRSKKYWARPVDGARKGYWGRIMDGLSGQGPDVFIVANGDHRTLMREMPSRNHWSNWDSTGLNWVHQSNSGSAVGDMDWYPPVNLGSTRWATRGANEVYNFRTRKYSKITPQNRHYFWSDAHWPKGGRKKGSVPACWREWDGFWNSTIHGSAGLWPGGRPLR